jgi:hypothetical protein
MIGLWSLFGGLFGSSDLVCKAFYFPIYFLAGARDMFLLQSVQ